MSPYGVSLAKSVHLLQTSDFAEWTLYILQLMLCEKCAKENRQIHFHVCVSSQV